MDTTTTYLGLRLPHPFIAGASPFAHHLDGVRRLEDAGCAAVVLHSLFEEQISLARDDRISGMASSDARFSETLAFYPTWTQYPSTPDAYAEHIAALKRSVSIPIIASLNGGTAQSWLTFARTLEQAGADALELNLYQVVTDPRVGGVAVEDEWVRMVTELKRLIGIPLAVKVTPFFTAFGNVARRLSDAGADALVLFNRFYQTDIDVATAKPVVRVELSHNDELPLRLRWIALLYGRVPCALALTGGVERPNDGVKAILAGATVVQMVSALMRHGPGYLGTMRETLERWLEWRQITGLDEARGLASLRHTADPAAFERASYLHTLQSWQ
ncbi:MAG: dihydroorotate dehydrogenase-like protein [Acidimicrobiia bacterium]|nr:dihydroorotate dehydrogenase-like protein [Acidimicrobiia bacterium]